VNAPAAPCEHEWRWLPKPEYHYAFGHTVAYAENVECARCGTRGWAHGHGPTNPRVIEHPKPTTGRS